MRTSASVKWQVIKISGWNAPGRWSPNDSYMSYCDTKHHGLNITTSSSQSPWCWATTSKCQPHIYLVWHVAPRTECVLVLFFCEPFIHHGLIKKQNHHRVIWLYIKQQIQLSSVITWQGSFTSGGGGILKHIPLDYLYKLHTTQTFCPPNHVLSLALVWFQIKSKVVVVVVVVR